VLVLGPLTSIPNAQTGVRLGLASRGAALVSETFNSNTINLLGGVLVPALFVAVTSRTGSERLDLAWLAGVTALCLCGLARRGGIGRRWGGLLVLLYAGFVVFQLVY
jgi:Ca2+/Na+ antiporter